MECSFGVELTKTKRMSNEHEQESLFLVEETGSPKGPGQGCAWSVQRSQEVTVVERARRKEQEVKRNAVVRATSGK